MCEAGEASARARRVLIGDDEEAVRTVLAEILAEEGFSVVGLGADGVETVSLALSLAPDVILVDLRMPRLGGIEAIRQIRPELPEARIVVLSAYDDHSLQVDAANAGADAFLVKGCSMGEVVAALAPSLS